MLPSNNNDEQIIIIQYGHNEYLVVRVKNWTTFLEGIVLQSKINYYDVDDVAINYSLDEYIISCLQTAGYECEIITEEALYISAV